MPKEERIIVKNMHTPLIDQETFDIVQDMIESRKGVRTKKYDWLIKGLIQCKECGKKLGLVPQKQKTVQKIKAFRYFVECLYYFEPYINYSYSRLKNS